MTEGVEVAMIRQIRDGLGLESAPGTAWTEPNAAGFWAEVDYEGMAYRVRFTVENLGVGPRD
jgi:hypothetical protein